MCTCIAVIFQAFFSPSRIVRTHLTAHVGMLCTKRLPLPCFASQRSRKFSIKKEEALQKLDECTRVDYSTRNFPVSSSYRVTALTVYTLQMRPNDTENQSIALQISTQIAPKSFF